MIIRSDWHMHSLASFDASLKLEDVEAAAKKYGFVKMGVTDHVNFNDDKFLADIEHSAKIVTEYQKKYPDMVLGVEFTPIEKPEYDYIAKNRTRDGYVRPQTTKPYDIELALTKEEMLKFGIKYAVGASHWCVDGLTDAQDRDGCIKEWYRQQMYMAIDDRVTILGHPWYNPYGLWYEDFEIVPKGMKMDLAAALKENGKYIECNSHFFTFHLANEKFRNQYAEYIREMFELGIPVTYGSDSHGDDYGDACLTVEKYLEKVGFKAGEFSEIKPELFFK